MSGHTPGPWKVFTGDHHAAEIWIEGADANVVAAVWGIERPADNDDTAKANARLIAAAPDLLAALEECRRVLSDLQSTNTEGTRTRNAWDVASAAIRKAGAV